MKFVKRIVLFVQCVESPSPRRAWIEMIRSTGKTMRQRSPSPRRAWIEMELFNAKKWNSLSPSPRRAWIEMPSKVFKKIGQFVALPTEGVD